MTYSYVETFSNYHDELDKKMDSITDIGCDMNGYYNEGAYYNDVLTVVGPALEGILEKMHVKCDITEEKIEKILSVLLAKERENI